MSLWLWYVIDNRNVILIGSCFHQALVVFVEVDKKGSALELLLRDFKPQKFNNLSRPNQQA